MGARITDASRVLYPDEARYLDTGDAHAFTALWSRYRDDVRAFLQAAGFTCRQAEARINDVFVRMMDSRESVDRSQPLRETLRDIAGGLTAPKRGECGTDFSDYEPNGTAR